MNRQQTHSDLLSPSFLLSQYNIHDNQARAGRQIVKCYLHAISRKVVLVAQMQSGKTGTAKFVTHYLLNCQQDVPIKTGRVWFICGMNDNDLRQQCITEFKGLIGPEQILFSKQLEKLVGRLKQQKASAGSLAAELVIIDESHYASCTNSLVDRFLELCSCDRLELSVSATPMAELSQVERAGKSVVILEPGPGYYSISNLFSQGLVKQASRVADPEQFADLVAQEYELQSQEDQHFYNIVRIPSRWYYQDLEDELNELDLDIDFINYHTKLAKQELDDFNRVISQPPAKMTIIWIYNSLRAGKQLNTANLGFVHDTANSCPDTIAQSLLGRILGYGKMAHQVRCYTDLGSAKKMLTWVKRRFDPSYIPQGSRHVVDGFVDKDKRWALHPPILVRLSEDAQEYYRWMKAKHGSRYPYKDEIYGDLAESAEALDRDQLENVLNNYLPGKHGGLMVLTEENAVKSMADHWGHNYQCWQRQKPTRGFIVETDDLIQDAPGYYYIYVNLNNLSSEYGLALVVYKELVQSRVPANHIQLNAASRFNVPLPN